MGILQKEVRNQHAVTIEKERGRRRNNFNHNKHQKREA